MLQGHSRPSPGLHPNSSRSGVVIAICKNFDLIAFIATESIRLLNGSYLNA